MPTYEYHCEGCGRDFEAKQRISEPALATCDVCGGAVRRLISAAPFILKGEGWYVTDYPSAARKKGVESEKSGSTTTSAAPAEKSGGDGATSSDKSSSDKPASTTAPTSSSSSSTSAASSD